MAEGAATSPGRGVVVGSAGVGDARPTSGSEAGSLAATVSATVTTGAG